jgi:hypothetical protein
MDGGEAAWERRLGPSGVRARREVRCARREDVDDARKVGAENAGSDSGAIVVVVVGQTGRESCP